MLFFRTQNFSPFLAWGKASGEKWEFTHHFSCFSHIHAGVRKYLVPYIWKKLIFFSPCFTLSLYKVSCAKIFISQWYMECEQGNGKPKHNTNARILLHWVALPLEIWKLYSCSFILLQSVVISVTESSTQRQEVHEYLMLPSGDSGWVYLEYGTLLLFIRNTAEVKWNTRQLYCLN